MKKRGTQSERRADKSTKALFGRGLSFRIHLISISKSKYFLFRAIVRQTAAVSSCPEVKCIVSSTAVRTLRLGKDCADLKKIVNSNETP